MVAQPLRQFTAETVMWLQAEAEDGDDLRVYGTQLVVTSEQRVVQALYENPTVGELWYGFYDLRVGSQTAVDIWDPMNLSVEPPPPVDPEDPTDPTDPGPPRTVRVVATRDEARITAGQAPLDDGVLALSSDLTTLFGAPAATAGRLAWVSELPPPIPGPVTATAGTSTAALSWTAPTGLGAPPHSRYIVQMSTNGGTTWTTYLETTGSATTLTATGLAAGVAHRFRVAAVNDNGPGLFTAASAAVTPVGSNPDTIPDLTHWLVADDITGVVSGGQVASWPNRVSGSAQQATGSAQPTLQPAVVNGHAAVRFSGAQRLTTTPTTVLGPQLTVFVVCKWTGSLNGQPNSGPVGADAGSGSSRVFNLRFDSTSQLSAVGLSTAGGTFVDSEPLSGGQATAWNVLSAVRSGNSVQAVVNGTSDGATSTTGTARSATRAVTIGSTRDDSGFFFVGDVAEVLLYTRSLTDTERASVRRYLGARYGVTVV